MHIYIHRQDKLSKIKRFASRNNHALWDLMISTILLLSLGRDGECLYHILNTVLETECIIHKIIKIISFIRTQTQRALGHIHCKSLYLINIAFLHCTQQLKTVADKLSPLYSLSCHYNISHIIKTSLFNIQITGRIVAINTEISVRTQGGLAWKGNKSIKPWKWFLCYCLKFWCFSTEIALFKAPHICEINFKT
jgi:hypothetical protein